MLNFIKKFFKKTDKLSEELSEEVQGSCSADIAYNPEQENESAE